MNVKTYGFCVVGYGTIGRMHAEAIGKLPNARLVAVCDINEERVRRFGTEFGCRTYTSLEQMVVDPEVDIVNICTPSFLHGEQAISCMQAGKHVIVEKPMDIRLETADRMIAASKENRVKLAVISQHRMDAGVVRVKEAIADGRLGRLIIGNGAVNWYRSQDYYDSAGWRGTWAMDGGGALMNQGIHTVDLLQHLMGPVASVYAHCETLGHERIEVEDAAVATLRFTSGAVGTLVATTCAYPGLSARIEVFGSKGSAVLTDEELTLFKTCSDVVSNQEEGSTTAASGASDPSAISDHSHRMQFADMIESIEQGREPSVNGTEGRKPLAIILAVYQSAREGRPIILG